MTDAKKRKRPATTTQITSGGVFSLIARDAKGSEVYDLDTPGLPSSAPDGGVVWNAGRDRDAALGMEGAILAAHPDWSVDVFELPSGYEETGDEDWELSDDGRTLVPRELLVPRRLRHTRVNPQHRDGGAALAPQLRILRTATARFRQDVDAAFEKFDASLREAIGQTAR